MITFKKAKSEIFAICLIKAIPIQKEDAANLINSQLKIWFKDFEKHNLIFTENQFIEALNKMADSEVFYNNMLPSLDIFKKYLKAKTLEELETSLASSKKFFYRSIQYLINCLRHERNELYKDKFHVLEQRFRYEKEHKQTWDFETLEVYFNGNQLINLEQVKNLVKKLDEQEKENRQLFLEKLDKKFNEFHKSEIEFLESSKIIKIDDNAQERKFKNMMQLN